MAVSRSRVAAGPPEPTGSVTARSSWAGGCAGPQVVQVLPELPVRQLSDRVHWRQGVSR